ncbi:MAG: zeta toxin family protein [Propionibacteriaceae bacterium]|nr:zeta toxin family protein [Propionibacteriaceae bacterium]
MQERILREFFEENPEVLRDRQVVVMAGPPGAGKSRALSQRIPDEEKKYWRSIDPDEFKARLLRHAKESGEYDALVPPEVRERMARGEVFAPGELAALVHEESSMLAEEARKRALRRGERVILDGVNGDGPKLAGRLAELAGHDYTHVDIICVEASREVSRARVEERWWQGYQRYAADPTDFEAGLKARYVPEAVTNRLFEDERFSTCSAAVAYAVEHAPEGFTVRADLYYVPTPTSSGEPWMTLENNGRGVAVEGLQDFGFPSPVAAVPVVSSGRADPGGRRDGEAAAVRPSGELTGAGPGRPASGGPLRAEGGVQSDASRSGRSAPVVGDDARVRPSAGKASLRERLKAQGASEEDVARASRVADGRGRPVARALGQRRRPSATPPVAPPAPQRGEGTER